jgi:gluconokinase
MSLLPVSLPSIVVMGVSGCGKSTIGQALARRLACNYIEGDDLHPPHNVALMAAGTPLTDTDRQGWLAAVAERLALARAESATVVVACSALKRAYRDRLRAADPALIFVHLQGSPDLLRQRLGQRQGHYMPASLLQSQLDALEPPQPDEAALQFNIDPGPDQIVGQLLQALEELVASTLASR